MVDDDNPERLVVVTSTPQGVSPLTPGERSMIEHEPQHIEQTAMVSHAFPNLLVDDPARGAFERAKEAFADSNGHDTVKSAREAIELRPTYLPALIYEELGMNLLHGRFLQDCADKCLAIVELAQKMIAGDEEPPPTERPITAEHINELLDMVRYNLSDRYMRMGLYREALEQVRMSSSLPKSTEGRMKRLLKEASLLFRLKDRDGCRIKLKQARAIERELFMLMRERMAFDGHAGVDQPI